MPRFAEELLLLILDNDDGDIVASMPPRSLNTLLAGALLMDLALENRIDSDLEQVTLVDATPVGDNLLDPVLADIQGMLTAEGMSRLDATKRIFMETLRMYPAIPGLTRTAANSFKLGGYTVPARSKTIVGNTVAHHLPQCFPNPKRFDIDRFLPERNEHSQPGAFAPFGLGTHRCLGSSFAEVQVVLSLLTIAHHAEITMDPPDYNLKIGQTTAPHPAKSFKFRLRRRRQHSRWASGRQPGTPPSSVGRHPAGHAPARAS